MNYYTLNIPLNEQMMRAIALHLAVAHGDEDVLAAANSYYEWMRGR